jgi:hypothetical protein
METLFRKRDKELEVATHPTWIYGCIGLFWCIDHLSIIRLMQIALTVITLTLALAYLGREVWKRFFAKETKCDSCAVGKAMNGQQP